MGCVSAKTLYKEHILQGKTLDELSQKYGLSRYRIHRLVMTYRMEELGEVVLTASYLRKKLITERCTYRDVAKMNCCSVSTVYRKARKYNIKPNRQPGNPKFFNPRT